MKNGLKKTKKTQIWTYREIKTYLSGLHGGVDSSIDNDAAEGELAGDCFGVGGTTLKVLLALRLVPVTHSAMSI